MPIFLCNSKPRDFIESFIDAVEGATQSKAPMKLKILEVETAFKSKLTRFLKSLSERRCRNQRVFEFEDHCSNKEKMITKREMPQHKFCKNRNIKWLSSKNIWNATAKYYQCSDLIAQNTTST